MNHNPYGRTLADLIFQPAWRTVQRSPADAAALERSIAQKLRLKSEVLTQEQLDDFFRLDR